MTISRKIVLHFSRRLVDQPIVSQLTKTYNLDFNILKASITQEKEGLMVLELTGDTENYEALPAWLRFALPALGGLCIGLLLQRLPRTMRGVGVVHVMERLAYHQGRLPLGNFLVQFFAGAISDAYRPACMLSRELNIEMEARVGIEPAYTELQSAA